MQVLGVNGNVYHIAKQLVTDTGDTVNFSNTDLTTYITSVSGLVAAQETIKITGGTGLFDGATGTLSFFGAISGGEVTLRYDGTLCFRPSSAGWSSQPEDYPGRLAPPQSLFRHPGLAQTGDAVDAVWQVNLGRQIMLR